MDFSKGNWDILGMIMEMKDKAEYEEKVEKLARKNFELVLKHIKESGSFEYEEVESEGFHYVGCPYKLDKSKLFFITREGRKVYPKNIRKSESFMEEMEDNYEAYLFGAVTDLLTYPWTEGNYDIPEGREYPNGLSLEQFTEHYIWDNGIHYKIRYSKLHGHHYCDYMYQQERCKEVLKMSDYLTNPFGRRDREKHETAFEFITNEIYEYFVEEQAIYEHLTKIEDAKRFTPFQVLKSLREEREMRRSACDAFGNPLPDIPLSAYPEPQADWF